MIRRAALWASSAILVGCSASSGAALHGRLIDPDNATPRILTERTLSYRADSFTQPTLDVSPDGRRLYFAAMGQIYGVPISGGLAEPLRLGAGWKQRPAVSPDGRNIAFLSDQGAGVTAWRSPLPANGSVSGKATQGFEATTLAWVGRDSLVSAGDSTSGVSGLGLTVDYEGEHGRAHLSGQGNRAGLPASMSADSKGNVFLHRPRGIVRIDASTGVEEIVIAAGLEPISQPRVTPDGAWLGFATTAGGTAHLVLKNLSNGELRDPGCRLNAWPLVPWNYGPGPEPSYAFIPAQQAVVLEREGRFLKCTFEGVETPIPVEADVTIDIARRVRPSPVREDRATGLPQDLASTADGRIVAFSASGHLWILDRSLDSRGEYRPPRRRSGCPPSAPICATWPMSNGSGTRARP